MKKYMGSWALMEYEEGLEKGIEKGLEQGLEKGRLNTLLRQIKKKFGPVPDWAQEKLLSADSDTLDRWTDAILDAPDLQELFAA
ncbi:MAG: DUF4351 domain-containing protein [Acidobacteriota bacterium]|nr:DUF4351 domain-containing protein [Acidobacteriota bacterium]